METQTAGKLPRKQNDDTMRERQKSNSNSLPQNAPKTMTTNIEPLDIRVTKCHSETEDERLLTATQPSGIVGCRLKPVKPRVCELIRLHDLVIESHRGNHRATSV
jgi:hypothetical protein